MIIRLKSTASCLALLVLALTLSLVGCDRHDTPVEGAVDGAKDALDMREHEKLKDAGEDAADAVDNAVDGVKDEVNQR